MYKILLFILIIPNIIYCQNQFTIFDCDSVNSKVIDILKKENIYPSHVKTNDIVIIDLIDKNNLVNQNSTIGIFEIYYHYHWNSYLLFKNKNDFTLFTNPLENTELVFKQITQTNKIQKEHKEYIEQVYNHLDYLIEDKYKRHKFFFSSKKELRELKRERKNKFHSERNTLKNNYKFYLDIVKNREK